MMVRKRNGKFEEFNRDKIRRAIGKAFEDVYGEDLTDHMKKIADSIADSVVEYVLAANAFDVEKIQDAVEEHLMSCRWYKVAKEYIRYRYLHELRRNEQEQKRFYDSVGDKLLATNVQNQNANVDEKSFGGRMGEACSEITRDYAIKNLLSDLSRENHLNNEIYIHDLDSYACGMHNCLSVPFDKLLANGFNTRQTDVRPANSVNTAFQLVAVIFQLQSLMEFGGVSATHLDWTMVPYVRKSFYKHYKDAMVYLAEENLDGELHSLILPKEYQEDSYKSFVQDMPSIEDEYFKRLKHFYRYALEMTEKEVYQAAEGLFHNLNTLQSRSGNQLPFTSANFGTCTLPEGRLVTKAILETSIQGLGKLHKTSIFPCTIFQCMKGVNRAPGDPNYDLFQLALKSTSQRLYPNYANVDWSGNAGYDKNDPKTYFSTMGKRKL